MTTTRTASPATATTPDATTVPAYAIAYLWSSHACAEIVEYLRRVDQTVAEFGGKFIMHGGRLTALEGQWPGDVIIIEFPSHQAALDWYHSPTYQQILHLRTDHSEGIVAIVDGEVPGYRASEKLDHLVATGG